MTDMRHLGEVALVTGANKGIGREIARRLAGEGMTVYLGSRDEGRGQSAAQELASDTADVRFLQVDVTDEVQIASAVTRVDEQCGRLDVLVNNAGIVVEWDTTVEGVTLEQVRRTYDVNVFGVIAMTRAFLPLLRRSANARVVNVSSALGSLSLMSDTEHLISSVGLLAYSSSKTALNAVTVLYANALREAGIRVNVVDPGYVATDLNGHRGYLTVEQGAEVPVKVALGDGGMPTGTFVGHDGSAAEAILPW